MRYLKIISGFIVLQIFLSLSVVYGQETTTKTISEKRNVIKINLPALAFKNISIQYERQIKRKLTAAINVHFIPYGKMAFTSAIAKAVNDSSIDFNAIKFGGVGFAPELRYYFSKKGAFHGFYMGLFLNYNNYKTALPVTYGDPVKKTGIFTGNVRSITGGLQLGIQRQLGKKLTLDLWLLGPNIGSGKGDFNFAGALDAGDRADLDKSLKQVQDNAPFNWVKSYSVSPTGATLNIDGPWFGLRSGINLGYRF